VSPDPLAASLPQAQRGHKASGRRHLARTAPASRVS